jgi:hypothetical protein
MLRVCTIIKRMRFLINLIHQMVIGISSTQMAKKLTQPTSKSKSSEKSIFTCKERTKSSTTTNYSIWTLMIINSLGLILSMIHSPLKVTKFMSIKSIIKIQMDNSQ